MSNTDSPPFYRYGHDLSLPPDLVEKVYRKLALASVDWEQIRISRHDVFEQLEQQRSEIFGNAYNNIKFWNLVTWDDTSPNSLEFKKMLFEIIPTVRELNSFSNQKLIIIFEKLLDEEKGILDFGSISKVYMEGRESEIHDESYIADRIKLNRKKFQI